MSLPVTALCSSGFAESPYAISGCAIYQGATLATTLNHRGISSEVSCASFCSPHLVVCAGQTIFIYKCIDGSLSLCYLITYPSLALSLFPHSGLWLISFMNGDWGRLDVSTGTLSCHRGSTGIFFSSHFLGLLFDGKALLALGSAAPLIELCLIDLEQMTYERIATISTVSFPIFCLRSLCLLNTAPNYLCFLLALSYKHAHVFSLAFSLTSNSSVTININGWPILNNVSRLYSGYIDHTDIYLGDETGNIHRYAYSYQHDTDIVFAPNYRVCLHDGIIRDMVILGDRLYTCGADGAVLSHNIKPFTPNVTNLLIEHMCAGNMEIFQPKDLMCLHISMAYATDTRCIILYMREAVVISNFASTLLVPLSGQKLNCFDEFVVEEELIIILGYTISTIRYIKVSLSPFKVSKTGIIDFASQLRTCAETVGSKAPDNLGISACHLLYQDATTTDLFVFVYGIGGVVVSCERDLSIVKSVSGCQYVSLMDRITVTNAETGVTSSLEADQKDLAVLGPLTSSIIRSCDGSSLVFVYTRNGQLQIFNYSSRGLYLLLPILTLRVDDNGKMRLYTHACYPSSQSALDHNKQRVSVLFISHSGKIQLIPLVIRDNKVVFCQQSSTRSILHCNSVLLSWEKYIVIASRDTEEWTITSLHPDRFTYSQGTGFTKNPFNDSTGIGTNLGICYDKAGRQYLLLGWSLFKLLIQPIKLPVLTAQIILSGRGSGSEINAFALIQDMLICGSETGEVILYDIDLKFLRVIYYCNASVRSISVVKLSSVEDLIILGSSSSQLVCLVWDIKSATVTGHSRFPIKYVQPKTDELDIRYTFILPCLDLPVNSQLIIFLTGVSIGELWLMCFVRKTRYVYLIERCLVHSVPVQLQWIRIGQEDYVVGAMTQGLIIAAIDNDKLMTLLAKMPELDQIRVGYTEHALSQRPLKSVCGIDDIITIKWQMRSTLQGSIISVLASKNFILTASDIGYLTMYAFEERHGSVQLIRENILQKGCTNGIICATNLPFLDGELSFVYIGWDRVPHYCKLSGAPDDVATIHTQLLSSVPLYNIHSILYVHTSSEANILIFCGSGLSISSISRDYPLVGGSCDELNKIVES